MKPIPAVGLASALVQIITFSITILGKEHAVYRPTDPDQPQISNAAILQSIINNLHRLTTQIDKSDLKHLHAEQSAQKKPLKLSEAATHLLKLSEAVKSTTSELCNAFIAAATQARSKPLPSTNDTEPDDKSLWTTPREALLTNSPFKKKDITSTKKKLRSLRREIDTWLLVALRQYLDQSAETGLPVFIAKDSASCLARKASVAKWQNDALDAVHAQGWRGAKKKEVEEFGKVVDELVEVESEEVFREGLFAKLWVEGAEEREMGIKEPLDGTLDWVFDEGGKVVEWLGGREGENLLWVTGKPGSGKSTLIRHLFRNPSIYPHLEAWSGIAPGISAAFFLWSCGTELQKSPAALLRSILYESLQDMIYGPLEEGQNIIQSLFADRWNQFTSYGGGLDDFTFPELRKAFETMVSDANKKFLFMIDGLDETDVYPGELVDTIIKVTKKDNVKIIASSRQSSRFQTAFKSRPCISMDQKMEPSIRAYIKRRIEEREELRIRQTEEKDGAKSLDTLITVLTKKADGVILWAQLATQYLFRHTSDLENISSFKSRAEELSISLDVLLPMILAEQSASLDRLLKVHALLEQQPSPSLLALSLAFTANMEAPLTTPIEPLRTSGMAERIEGMTQLIDQNLSEFFSIIHIPPTDEKHPTLLSTPKITYANRTIYDFLATHQHAHSLPQTFKPTTQWAISHLTILKSLPQIPSPPSPWPHFLKCLSSALKIHSETHIFPLTYLDTAGSTFLSLAQSSTPPPSDIPSTPSCPLQTFLDIAVWLDIRAYMRIKVPTSERKDVKHAVEFRREMGRWWGADAKTTWLKEEPRNRNRRSGRSRSSGGGSREGEKEKGDGDGSADTEGDIDALLAYYSKSVRFSTGKKGLGGGEVEWI